jgi:hypothetical protein
MTHTKNLVGWMVLAGAACAGGCSDLDNSSPPVAKCHGNADCGGLLCVNGACQPSAPNRGSGGASAAGNGGGTTSGDVCDQGCQRLHDCWGCIASAEGVCLTVTECAADCRTAGAQAAAAAQCVVGLGTSCDQAALDACLGTGTGGSSASGGATGTGGSAVGGGTGGGTTLSLQEAIAQFSDAFCTRLDDCAPGMMSWDFGSTTECVNRTVFANTWTVSLPAVKWNAQAFVTCAESWSKASCAALYTPVALPGCTYNGTRPSGQPCNASEQCSTGFCRQTGYQCGQCAVAPQAGSTACTTDADCGPGLWCMADSICNKPATIGQSCNAYLYCTGDANCVSGLCVAKPRVAGAACNPTTGVNCDWTANLTCSGSTCVSVTARPVNATCAAGNYCEQQGSCVSGVCQAGPSDQGGSCDPTTGPSCVWPALCASGACQMPTSVALCPAA